MATQWPITRRQSPYRRDASSDPTRIAAERDIRDPVQPRAADTCHASSEQNNLRKILYVSSDLSSAFSVNRQAQYLRWSAESADYSKGPQRYLRASPCLRP